jgi:Uma2 family endonuclease
LNGTSEPQPDIALDRQPWRGYPDAHPQPVDVFLLVEVADSSLDLDRGAKLEVYARAGIREFWIVDVTTNSVLVHRGPHANRYDRVSKIDPPGMLEVEDLPGVQVAAAALFV